MNRNPFVVEPYSDDCRLVFERRDHVVAGVSPGNSYFNVDLLADLLGWLSREFGQVDVVVPDSGLVHTYLALGYSPEKAAKKARAESNVLVNRVQRGWARNGGPRQRDAVHRMSDLVDRKSYRTALHQSEQLLAEDRCLRTTALRTSRECLLARRPGSEPTSEQVDRALQYLLAELPFFLASADIFGVPSSLGFYHQVIPLADDIFAGRTGVRASPRQGYALIYPNNTQEPLESGRNG